MVGTRKRGSKRRRPDSAFPSDDDLLDEGNVSTAASIAAAADGEPPTREIGPHTPLASAIAAVQAPRSMYRLARALRSSAAAAATATASGSASARPAPSVAATTTPLRTAPATETENEDPLLSTPPVDCGRKDDLQSAYVGTTFRTDEEEDEVENEVEREISEDELANMVYTTQYEDADDADIAPVRIPLPLRSRAVSFESRDSVYEYSTFPTEESPARGRPLLAVGTYSVGIAAAAVGFDDAIIDEEEEEEELVEGGEPSEVEEREAESDVFSEHDDPFAPPWGRWGMLQVVKADNDCKVGIAAIMTLIEGCLPTADRNKKAPRRPLARVRPADNNTLEFPVSFDQEFDRAMCAHIRDVTSQPRPEAKQSEGDKVAGTTPHRPSLRRHSSRLSLDAIGSDGEY